MLSVWSSFADLNRLQREFDRSFFADSRARAADFAPAVDVHEDSEALVLRAELPGVHREDIEIQVDGNVLTLKGERKADSEQKDRRYHRVERAHGTFVRQFQLPPNVDSAAVEAALADGVLTLKLPKKQEQKARKIEVKNGANGN